MITKVISGYVISIYALMISVQCISKAILVYDYKSDIRLLYKCVLCINDVSAVYLEDIS